MSKSSGPALTSDHVNYLVWRYLQETGHGQAAAKLEGEWSSEHPSTLPFAQNINPHALVSLVHKGLQFNKVNHDLRNPESGARVSALEAFFGTAEGRRASLAIRGHSDGETVLSKGPRKHERNGTANGLSLDLAVNEPLPKRSRHSGTHASINGDTMQIDQNGYHDRQDNGTSSNNYSPADNAQSADGMEIDDQPASPASEAAFTLTNGGNRGLQNETTVDLTDQTIIQTLSSSKQAILQLTYNPQDPTILAAGGEALARIWQTSKTAGTAGATQISHDILPPSDDAFVSDMAWSPDGEAIAVASRNPSSFEYAGIVSIWTKNGKCIGELPATTEMVTLLRWNPTGTHLLGLSSSGITSSSLIVWDPSDTLSAPMPCQVEGEIMDVVWKDDTHFGICGRGIIATSYMSAHDTVVLELSSDTEVRSRTWTHVCFDTPFNNNLYASDEEGSLALLNRNCEITNSCKAHEAGITALRFRPLDILNGHKYDSPRILASSSIDGTAKIWNSKTLECLNILSLGGVTSPASALSFTADGNLLAIANTNRILVFSPEDDVPKASWRGELGRNPKRGLTNGNGQSNGNGNGNGDVPRDRDSAIGDDAEDEVCCLTWDAAGKKLAAGSGSQFAIVTFGP